MVYNPIASHRGGAILWPENSPTAFRNTAALPVAQVEFDVHLSADGVPVVIHDATLDRTTEATGPVGVRTAAALGQVRLKGTAGETIQTLAAVARIFAPTPIGLRVELKPDAEGAPYPGLAAATLGVLAQEGMAERTVITAFQAPMLAEAIALGQPAARTIWLLSPRTQRETGLEGAIAAARAQGIGGIGLHATLCDADSMAALRDAGLSAGAWAVNGEAETRRILGLRPDAFTTDDPVLALRLLRGA